MGTPQRKASEIHHLDIAAAAARDSAHVAAAFWRELVKEGVDKSEASTITIAFVALVFPEKSNAGT